MYVRFHTRHIVLLCILSHFILNDMIVCMLSLQLFDLRSYLRFAHGTCGACSPYSHATAYLPTAELTSVSPHFRVADFAADPFAVAFWNFHMRLSQGSLSASGIVDLESVSIFTLFRHPQSFLMRGHQLPSSSVLGSLYSALTHAWHC